MTNNNDKFMPNVLRIEIQNVIDELYDYGVDVDENGNPDILMRTVTELTRIRHIISRPQPSADVMNALKVLADYASFTERKNSQEFVDGLLSNVKEAYKILEKARGDQNNG